MRSRLLMRSHDLHGAGNWVVRSNLMPTARLPFHRGLRIQSQENMIERLSALIYAATLCTVLLILTADTRAQTSPPALTTLATLHGAPLDGIDPLGVVIGSGGVLYGVTQSGGSMNNGMVFSLTPPKSTGGPWTEAVLYNFTGGTDGGSPTGVVIGNGGVLYGTTQYGGGTVFSLTPPASGPSGSVGPWTEKVLYSFTGVSAGAYSPTNLVIGTGGVLYGTSGAGGNANSGAVFSLTPPTIPSGAWTEAVLYSFPAPSAYGGGDVGPSALAIGSGGVFYGATRNGGTAGTVPLCQFPPGGCGTVFSLTPPASPGGAWTEATLYSFTGGSDGAYPTGVVIGSGGVLYGVASNGGPSSTGVVFALTPPAGAQSGTGGAWTESVLYTGGSGADLGLWPLGVVLVFELLSGFLAIECPIDRDAISVGSPVPGAGFRPENPDLAESALPQTLLGKAFVRGICGWVEFRWHDKCLIGMEFPNAEPPLLCSIFHSSFECGPDGRAPSILRGCHGHVTLLPSIPGRALDQNHHQPRPTKTNLNQNQTKTI